MSVEDPSVPLTSKNIAEWLNLSVTSNAGVSVSEQTALGVPAFFKGVNLISHSVAKTPIHIFRRSNEGRDRARTHPADKLLNGRWNRYQSSLIGKDTLQKDALVTGNGYAWIERDPSANPVGLWRLEPTETYPKFLDDGTLVYQSRIKNEEIIILAENVLHIKGIGDGIVGYSVLAYMTDAIGLGIAQQRYAASYFGHGAIPPAALKLKGVIKSDEARANLRRSWQAVHSGPSNAHKLAILEEGAELETLGIDPAQSQLIESRKLSLIDFANLLGIPASWLGGAVNTSYKSLEHEDRAFLRDGLDFWLCQWEAEVGMKLLTERQQSLGTHYAEFVREALIRMETKQERDVLLAEYHGGVRSWEECRKILNLPTEPDGWYLRKSGVTPETFEIEEPEPQPPPEPQEETKEDIEPQEIQQSLEDITAATVARLFARLEKASRNKGTDWLDDGLQSHWVIFQDNLSPVTTPEKIQALWDDLTQELQSVSSKDWPVVFQSKDPVSIVRSMLE